MKNQKGFTLIELIIVVAVIGILAAITAPSLSNMIDRSRSRSFARGIANQYRFARNQAASTNQAFVVRLYRQNTTPPGGDTTPRGRVEVWAVAGTPSNCRAVNFPLNPPADANMISAFESILIGGDMLIRKQSHTGSNFSTVCVQPNGEFLEVSTGARLPLNPGGLSSRLCIGETMVIPIWRNSVSFPDDLYDCARTTTNANLESRAEYDYWRISLWDNGQVTASRK